MTESIGPEEAVDLYLNDREAEATESTSVFINPERSLLMGADTTTSSVRWEGKRVQPAEVNILTGRQRRSRSAVTA